MNQSVVSKNHPLFSNNLQEFCDMVNLVFPDNVLFKKASKMMFEATQKYILGKVYQRVKIQF